MATFKRRKAKNNIAQFPKALRPNKNAERSEYLDQDAGDNPPVRRRRGIYLLPNAFTTAALFCGFYAIVMAMNLRFDQASIAIFVAMVLDSLDGRVARLTNTQSEFGAQYDSLSDMVSFGAAPALVVYEWSLRGMGKLGWIAAFVYVAEAALRLARLRLLCIAPAALCAWRASTPISRWSTNAISRVCPAPRRQPWWPVLSG